MRKLSRNVVALLMAPLALLAADAWRPADAQGESRTTSGGFDHVHALAVTADGRALLLGTHSGLWRSGDGGRTWQPVALPGRHVPMDIMAVTPDPRDPAIIYVATHEAGAFKTTDGAKTWREINRGLGGPDVHGLAVDPRDPQKLHAAVRDQGGGIYRSVDGGGAWVRVDDGPRGEVKVLASVNIPTGMGGIFLYAGTAEGLLRNPDCF